MIVVVVACGLGYSLCCVFSLLLSWLFLSIAADVVFVFCSYRCVVVAAGFADLLGFFFLSLLLLQVLLFDVIVVVFLQQLTPVFLVKTASDI